MAKFLLTVQKYVIPFFLGKKRTPTIKAKGEIKEVKKDIQVISKQVKAQEEEMKETMKLIKAYLKQQAMLQGATIDPVSTHI